MRPAAAPLPLLAASLLLPLLLPAAPAARGSLEPPPGNGSRPPAAPGPGNHSGARLSPVPAVLRDLSALKAAVIGACALTAALIACLLLRVFRWGAGASGAGGTPRSEGPEGRKPLLFYCFLIYV